MQDSNTSVAHHDVVIVGAGFSGLGMAIFLKKAGRNDFVMLEKGDGIGGTWRDNNYPGAACDVPSHMYSYSFEQNPDWSRMYSGQAEILSYMQRCADKYGVMPHFRGGEELIEARWDDGEQRWHLRSGLGNRYTCRVLVSGIGALSRPALPRVKGLDSFEGTVFHSARWNHDYDLTGKRVAVVGTGASAIQFVPEIAPKVGKLTLFQRTAPWLVPKPDGQLPSALKSVFRKIPGSQTLFRNSIYWQAEAFGLGFVNPKLMKPIELISRSHLKRQVKDPVLRAKLTPNYTIGCKRVLFTNNYYPALCRENVDVVAAGVQEVRANGVLASDGSFHEVDAIICGTGFDVMDPLGPLNIIGPGGHEVPHDGNMQAYLGITVKHLPNLFMLLGPNTGLGHNSIIFMIESQINYVMQCLDEMDKRKARTLLVKPEAHDAFNAQLQQDLKRMVWSTGCNSWYLNDKGENFTVWPGLTCKYWLQTRKPVFEDLQFA